MTQKDIDREWARMFLENWNRAVKLWDDGRLFSCRTPWSAVDQKEYARICVSWLTPNNFNEPHMTAEGY